MLLSSGNDNLISEILTLTPLWISSSQIKGARANKQLNILLLEIMLIIYIYIQSVHKIRNYFVDNGIFF